MFPTVVLEAVLGFGGAAIYATNKLWTGLCAGDKDPTPREKALAWGRFGTALFAGPLFSGTGTDWAANTFHAPWPPLAVTIGLFGNALWPLMLSVTAEGLRDRIRKWLAGASTGEPS